MILKKYAVNFTDCDLRVISSRFGAISGQKIVIEMFIYYSHPTIFGAPFFPDKQNLEPLVSVLNKWV